MPRSRRRRKAQRAEQSAVRSEQIDPRQRRDLWCDHQRQHEAEDQRLLATQIGKRNEQRECSAKHHREDDATQRYGQRVAGSAPHRRVLENTGEQGGIELAAGCERLLGEAADRHDGQQDDHPEENEEGDALTARSRDPPHEAWRLRFSRRTSRRIASC